MGNSDVRERLLIASAVKWQLQAAINLLSQARVNLRTISEVIPGITLESVEVARCHADIALAQLEAVIQRMP